MSAVCLNSRTPKYGHAYNISVDSKVYLLSVQCYAIHKQNINLHVCVSVTLSVNSPTGQTPQRIFTVDSLKDVDLRKDVPIGGLDDE